MAAGQLSREGEGRLAVERRWQQWRGKRNGVLDAERGDQQRKADEQPGTAVEAPVDRPLWTTAPPPPGAGGWRFGRDSGAIVRPPLGRPVMPESATILLVDDEESVQKLLTYPLERDGYRVVQARDGEEALARFDGEEVDLVVLDVMLPRLDGLEVCKRLRARSSVPIVMLTARDDELDKVLGLELGADDYITKPFSIREFRSRVRALLRRALAPRQEPRDAEAIEVEGLRVDPARRTVEIDGRPVQLTYVEFELLRTLAQRPGRVFSRQALLEALWGSADYREPRTIDVHVRHLREKLEDDPREPLYILTVRGVGYRFRER